MAFVVCAEQPDVGVICAVGLRVFFVVLERLRVDAPSDAREVLRTGTRISVGIPDDGLMLRTGLLRLLDQVFVVVVSILEIPGLSLPRLRGVVYPAESGRECPGTLHLVCFRSSFVVISLRKEHLGVGGVDHADFRIGRSVGIGVLVGDDAPFGVVADCDDAVCLAVL